MKEQYTSLFCCVLLVTENNRQQTIQQLKGLCHEKYGRIF